MKYVDDEDIGRLLSWRVDYWAKKQRYVDREDLNCISLLAAIKAMNNFKEDFGTKKTTYITICVDNAIKTALKKESKNYNLREKVIKEMENRVENETIKNDVRMAILEALEPIEQKIIDDYFYKRKTLKEIAKELETNEVNIFRRLNVAKKKIKDYLVY